MLRNYTESESSRQASLRLYSQARIIAIFILLVIAPAFRGTDAKMYVCVTYSLRHDSEYGSCRRVSLHLFILRPRIVYILHVIALLRTVQTATVLGSQKLVMP